MPISREKVYSSFRFLPPLSPEKKPRLLRFWRTLTAKRGGGGNWPFIAFWIRIWIASIVLPSVCRIYTSDSLPFPARLEGAIKKAREWGARASNWFMLVPSVALLEWRSNFICFTKSANEMIASFLVHIWQNKCIPIALIESFCVVFLVVLQLFGQLHFFRLFFCFPSHACAKKLSIWENWKADQIFRRPWKKNRFNNSRRNQDFSFCIGSGRRRGEKHMRARTTVSRKKNVSSISRRPFLPIRHGRHYYLKKIHVCGKTRVHYAFFGEHTLRHGAAERKEKSF